MSDTNDGLLGNTICKTCFYYVYREIRPFEEFKEQWEEEFGIDLEEDSVIETHMCSLLNVDLDHMVFKCNKYISKEQAMFNNNVKLFK